MDRGSGTYSRPPRTRRPCAYLVGRPRRRDHLHDLIRHSLRRLDHLFMRCRPGKHLSDIVEEFLRHSARLHDVRLLAEVLRDEEAGAVERRLAVMIHGADHELGAIDVIE